MPSFHTSRGHRVLDIARDPDTRLPLLRESTKVLELILNYLPLPYSVVEYGCGQKASIIVRSLVLHHDIPHFAVQRGLISEPDMSEAALEKQRHEDRPHALTVRNPLRRRTRLEHPVLQTFLAEAGFRARPDDASIEAGPFELHLWETVQFVKARSHVFVILTFWDDEHNHPVERVVDPTLDRNNLFPVEETRQLLTAPEALIFTAPIRGRFRLSSPYLTESQNRVVSEKLRGGGTLDTLPDDEHDRLVRDLVQAEPGSIGDPATWTHVNNIAVGNDDEIHQARLRETGHGEPAREAVRDLLAARASGRHEVLETSLRSLRALSEKLAFRESLQEEAERCEKALAPLARVANLISYFNSVEALSKRLREGGDPLKFPAGDACLREMHGIGVRLRRRIEEAAAVSRDDEGRIDARALNDRYFQAAVATIRQMNQAGLSVLVDRAGNLHGLWLNALTAALVRDGTLAVKELVPSAICFGSHIDTVRDAGKYDGRLGVFSGIEIVHLLGDLERHFDLTIRPKEILCPLMVSVFVGEEMTFTGSGVSLPGSAAVAGLATTDQIDAMTNASGERFVERLVEMLRHIRNQAAEGRIEVMNRFNDEDAEQLLAACHAPGDFFARQSYERHIEQGTVLQGLKAPLAIVDTVMGIRHEDLHLTGPKAEAAACELNRRLRRLTERAAFHEVRVTVPLQERLDDGDFHPLDDGAMRWTPKPTDSLRTSSTVRLSIDFRASRQETMARFREAIDEQLQLLPEEFDVEISAEIHQQSPPLSLQDSGRVLQLERNYGGSHNPKETEMAADVLQGTLFQLAVVCRALREGNLTNLDLAQYARAEFPPAWRQAKNFVSRGLHDTANLALGFDRRKPRP